MASIYYHLRETNGFRVKMAFAIITAIYLCLFVATSVLAYYGIKEAMYVAKDLPLFSSIHAVASVLFICIAVFTTIGFFLMWCALLDLDSCFSKRKLRTGKGMIILATCATSCIVFGAGVSNFLYRSETIMRAGISKYQNEMKTTEAIDKIQNEFSCCGINGYRDWKWNSLFTCASSMSPFTCGIPQSCCKNKTMIKKKQTEDMFCGIDNLKQKDGIWQIGENGTSKVTPSDIMHLEGCISKVRPRLSDSRKKIIIYASIHLVIQCFSIFLLCAAVRGLEKERLTLEIKKNRHLPLNRLCGQRLSQHNERSVCNLSAIPEPNPEIIPAERHTTDPKETVQAIVHQVDSNSSPSTPMSNDDIYYDAKSSIGGSNDVWEMAETEL